MRRELVVELTQHGQEIVHAVTAHRREEIARVVHSMPERERYGLVSTLTAFTTAGGESQTRLEIEGLPGLTLRPFSDPGAGRAPTALDAVDSFVRLATRLRS
jgi:hypothetical protein